MNPLEFGVFITPQSTDLDVLREEVHAAEDGGLDFITIQDHHLLWQNNIFTFQQTAEPLNRSWQILE